MIAAKLANFVSGTSTSMITENVYDRTLDLCVSALGSAILGSTTEIPVALAKQIKTDVPIGIASNIGFGFATSVEQAAMLNCTSSHATEYEDVSWPEGQYTNCLIPALFSLGESLKSSGQELIESIILGFEVASRPAFYVGGDTLGRGFLNSSCFGAIGVAAGAARLMRLGPDGALRAITLAASMAGGLIRQAGSSGHVLEAGLAGRNGISAAQLAASGFSGSKTIMDGPRGFFDAYSGHANPDIQIGPEHSYRVLAVGQKKYPCGYRMQRILDGLLDIIQDNELTSETIETVEIHANGAFSRFVKFPAPDTVEEARLSLNHVVSAALLWGYADFRAFTAQAVADPALKAMRPKIKLVEHPEWGDDMIGKSDLVKITTASGVTHEQTCISARGDGDNPLNKDQTIGKFLFCTKGVITSDQQQEIINQLYQLRTTANIAPLMQLLSRIGG